MKAREPDRTGVVERDGVRVAWREYGELPDPDAPAVLLLPTWRIVSAEVWKLQVPFLARRTRVLTFDPRGNGLSDRPRHREAYGREELAQDAIDVLDATGTRRTVVVGLSAGNEEALTLAAEHPERVAAWVAIAPSIRGLGDYGEERAAAFARWNEDTGADDGWDRYNRYSWLRDYPGFVTFFFDQAVNEPRSTKLVEDLVGWSRGTDAEILVLGELALKPPRTSIEEQTAAVRCPVVVVHGTRDGVVPHAHGARLAELTGGTLVTFEGSGHLPQGRDPVAVNRVIDSMVSVAGSGFRPGRPTPAARSRG
ncbi:MAG TPA: alpha/beta hydrolase [Nocardioides sp.]|uniref:alpha/beta hydrolase n=1 Tax=Nocardioides sp. TaxID=35761 RepID=UPI002F3F664E